MWLASLVSQTGDLPCGRVAAAARRELSTHRSGEVRRRWRWCDRRCLVVGATRGDSDHDGRGEFVLCGWRASSVKGPIVRAGVFLRLLGVSCLLIGAARVVEDGAGAIDAVLSLVRLAATVPMTIGEFVLAAGLEASGREAVEATLGMHGRVGCPATVCQVGV